jgi:hypothetical protein
MRTTRQHRVRERMMSIFYQSRTGMWSQAEYLKTRGEYMGGEDWKKTSGTFKDVLLAELRGMSEALYWYDLVWCHFVNGRFVSAYEYRQTSHGAESIDPEKSARVWRISIAMPEQKVY